ncbi:uncharacterized protein with beta-barrel porin domain [Beijerinckia sp. GAS462]|nr:uncharacterized protein with beta-barrel porin domain [Beijerinckia sp. GAS462]
MASAATSSRPAAMRASRAAPSSDRHRRRRVGPVHCGGGARTWHDIHNSHSVAFMGFNDALRGHCDARTSPRVRGSRLSDRCGALRFRVLRQSGLRRPEHHGFQEMGGAAAVTGQGRTSSVTFSTLGLRVASQFDLGGMALTARDTLGWRHTFGGMTPQASSPSPAASGLPSPVSPSRETRRR